MNIVRALVAFVLSGYFLWHAFGPNAAADNRRNYYIVFGLVLLALGLWRLTRKPKAY